MPAMPAILSRAGARPFASRAYLVGSTLFGIAGIAAFTRSVQKPRFAEIDVERINVIAPNGTPRLVLSNAERAPDVIINGKTYHRSGSNEAGMIFYNEEGSENGGMGFSGRTRDGHVSASAGFMFDQYGQDQTVGLTYNEQDGRRSAGLRVWDRPNQSVTVLADMVEPIKLMPPPGAYHYESAKSSDWAARSVCSSGSRVTRRRPWCSPTRNHGRACASPSTRRGWHASSFSTSPARS